MNKGFIYKRRLLKLADFLDTLPKQRFNYEHWVGRDWQGAANLSCGTTACALGWATTIPSLRKAGLILRRDEGSSITYVSLKSTSHQSRGAVSNQAGNEVFGLSYEEFMYVFIPHQSDPERQLPNSPGMDATAKQVADHIRRFTNRKYG